MSYEDIMNKYIYIFMRSGAIHEIKLKGKTFDGVAKTLNEKGIIIFNDEKLLINSVDISEIMNVWYYIKWINQKRPKVFIMAGKMTELAPKEVYKGVKNTKGVYLLDYIESEKKKRDYVEKINGFDNNKILSK